MSTVLLVDDENSVRQALRKILEHGGMTIVEADSADSAMAVIRTGATLIDAVVSDVLMPGTSGLAFYDELIRLEPSLNGRVVFLSGAARDPAIHDPIERLGVPLLSKLDDLMLVLDAVRIATLKPRQERSK
ncbi:MAG: response regulator [Gemmatimonadota bacterium]